jgi:ECF sigma factor
MSEVTRILAEIEQGASGACDGLLPLVYEELRKLAGARLAREKPGQTLEATALVHEAYLLHWADDRTSGRGARRFAPKRLSDLGLRPCLALPRPGS